jgi:alanyl-tRNA synthetase
MFKIVSESGVSAGVRRIEALAGDQAVRYALNLIEDDLQARKVSGVDHAWDKIISREAGSLSDYIEKKKDEIKQLEKEIRKAQGGSVNVDSILKNATSFKSKAGSSNLVIADLDLDDRDVLSQVTDQLKNKVQSGIVVVLGKGSGSHPLIVSVTKDLNPDMSAGNILKDLAQAMGGKGGGRPDFAQGAVPNREAFATATTNLKAQLAK